MLPPRLGKPRELLAAPDGPDPCVGDPRVVRWQSWRRNEQVGLDHGLAESAADQERADTDVFAAVRADDTTQTAPVRPEGESRA